MTVSLRFDGETIAEVGFEGRGCAISQAATSMLTEIVVGRSAEEVARMPKEELLEEIGIPLTPVRLKCAILGLGVLKVALHKSKGTPLPDEWTQGDDLTIPRLTVDVCPVAELPPGHVKIVWSGPLAIGVYNCDGSYYAIEDRCSHDDGPLCEGEWEEDECVAICPRHGSRFDITTGAAADAAGLRARRHVPGPGRGRLGEGRGLALVEPPRLTLSWYVAAACYILDIRGKEVVRQWRFPVRAVEVSAGRDVPLGPARGIV